MLLYLFEEAIFTFSILLFCEATLPNPSVKRSCQWDVDFVLPTFESIRAFLVLEFDEISFGAFSDKKVTIFLSSQLLLYQNRLQKGTYSVLHKGIC